MLDFRYHIASLAAMFLMLGIGIWIGSTSNFGTAMIKHQTNTIQELSAKLDGVLKDSEHDQNLLRKDQEAMLTLVPRLVAGKLSGKRIAIIRTGDYSDAAVSAKSAIEAAGGTVSSVTVITDRLTVLDNDQRAGIVRELKAPAATDSLATILHPLVASLRVGTGSRADIDTQVNVLIQDGLIDSSGDYGNPVSEVVVVGGEQSDIDESSTRELVSLLTDSSATPQLDVVGCEPEYAVASSFTDFSASGIATVDCIDLPLGALDLPFALSGETAEYGVKQTATRLLPQSLESSDDSDTQSSPVSTSRR